MPLVVVPIDLECPKCGAQVARLELDQPAVLEQGVRIGVTLRCSGCPQSVVYGEKVAEVTPS